MPPVAEVLLYVPNVIGYARLACIVYGFHAPGCYDSSVRAPLPRPRVLRGDPIIINCKLDVLSRSR